jgi:drug/metabolite transporter (DMT)-like permease
MLAATVLALMAAVSSATGDLAQRVAARAATRSGSAHALPLRLAHRRAWWAGVGATLLGFTLHLGALSVGAVSAVQPVMTAEMPLAVLGIAAVFKRPLARRDVLAVLSAAVGLVLLVAGLAPTGGDRLSVPGATWAVGVGVTLAVAAVLTLAGRHAVGDARAELWGVAGGVGYGLSGVLFAVTGRAFTTGGVVEALAAWQTWAAVACGMTSFLLIQNAFAAGKLLAVEPGLTLSNPLVATVWGLAVFGETARTGPILLVAVAGAVLLSVGVVLIARSPVLEHHATAGAVVRPLR